MERCNRGAPLWELNWAAKVLPLLLLLSCEKALSWNLKTQWSFGSFQVLSPAKWKNIFVFNSSGFDAARYEGMCQFANSWGLRSIWIEPLQAKHEVAPEKGIYAQLECKE